MSCHQWGLTRFVEDPRIPLDNNAAERALRGTEVAAAFYTLCETARLVGVDPRAYFLRAGAARFLQRMAGRGR